MSLTLRNLRNADSSDINALKLWLDTNSDSIWQPGDSLIGAFGYVGGEWRIDSWGIEVADSPISLMVIGDISPMATPDAAFQGIIPLYGCQYSSANDGPWDAPVQSPNTFTISNSGLRISCQPLPETRSIGQPITITVAVTNVSGASIDSVVGQVVEISDPATIVLDSSYSGPINLLAGQSTNFEFYYTARDIGQVSWRLRAISPVVLDSSAIIQTNDIAIQTPPANIPIELTSSLPTAVARGQTNVFPLSVSYSIPDTQFNHASLRLDSLRVCVEDGNGMPLSADDVFSRIVLATGYTNLTILEDVPSQSNLSLIFDHPVILPPGQIQRYTLLVDIDSTAAASNFALAFIEPDAIPLLDANTLQRASLDPDIQFPLRTTSCRIDNPSAQMAVTFSSTIGQNINYGQNARILKMRLRHPGTAGGSQINLTHVTFRLADSVGNSIDPSELIDLVEFKKEQFVVGYLTQFDSSLQHMQLTSPVTLNPGEIEFLEIFITVNENAHFPGFQFVIDDSSCFVVRDLSSGSLIEAVSDTSSFRPLPVFPITSGWARLRQPAISPQLCIASMLSTSVIAGVDSIQLLSLAVAYHADSIYSPIQLRHLLVMPLDSSGFPLDPTQLFDRIGVAILSQQVTYQPYIRLLNGFTEFTFGDSGLCLDPGDSTHIELVADLEAEPPYGNFALVVPASDALSICDATDTTRSPGVSIAPDCDFSFPFATNVVQILFPASRPSLACSPIPAQITFLGQKGITIFSGDLTYNTPHPNGDLGLQAIGGNVLQRTTNGFLPVQSHDIFDAIYLTIDGQITATDTSLTADSINIQVEGGYKITRGSHLPIVLSCDLSETAPLGNYIINFGDSSFLELVDRNLSNYLYVNLIGNPYPLQSAELSVSSASLEESFTNYPNPFYPTRGEKTTIGFVLTENATIEITIYTITGETVKHLASNSHRGVGSYQIDTWRGDNDYGRTVMSGAYICQIEAKYASGRKETFRRKIAVLK